MFSKPDKNDFLNWDSQALQILPFVLVSCPIQSSDYDARQHDQDEYDRQYNPNWVQAWTRWFHAHVSEGPEQNRKKEWRNGQIKPQRNLQNKIKM